MTYNGHFKRLTHVITSMILLWIECNMNKIRKSNGQKLVGGLFQLITMFCSLKGLGDLVVKVSKPPLMKACNSQIKLCENEFALMKRFESCYD